MLSMFYYGIFFLAYFFSLVSFVFRFSSTIAYETNPWTFLLLMVAMIVFAMTGNDRFLKMRPLLVGVSFLLPGTALLWEKTLYGRLEMASGWVILLIFLIRQIEVHTRESFISMLKKLMFVYVLPLVLLFFGSDHEVAALETAIPYLIIMFTAVVLMLQDLRFEADSVDKKRFEKSQIGQTFLFFAGCFALTAGRLVQLIGYVLRNWVIRPFLNFLEKMLNYFRNEPDEQIHLTSKDKTFLDLQEYMDAMEQEGQKYADKNLPADGWPQAQTEPKELDFTTFFIIFGVFLVLFLIVVLFLQKKKTVVKEVYLEEIEELEPEKQAQKKERSEGTTETVRKQYKNFMSKTDKKQTLSATDTTEEIREKYESRKKRGFKSVDVSEVSESNLAAQELTELYRKARYQESAMSKEEANRAKKLVKELK